jgi:heme-degrading monooxygenase HmoA
MEASAMIVMLSARRLKPGSWDAFRRAWEPGDTMPPGFQRAFHARNIRDEDEVVSFGLFEMTKDDYHAWRDQNDAGETKRVDSISDFVHNEYVAGVYEVIEVVEDERTE